MSLRNKITLIGFTGKAPEITTFENGSIKSTCTLATTDYFKNSTGEKIEETQWHTLVAYGKTAELFRDYIKKGKEIAVEGKLTYRTFPLQDGTNKTVAEIRVEEVLFLGTK